MIVFGVIDAFVDLRNPHLEAKSFKQRYIGLSKALDTDIVFSEMYRIFRVLRNATIHAKSALSISPTGVAVDYPFNKTLFQLNCNKGALSLLYSLAVIYAQLGGSFNSHGEGILRNYYDTITGGITGFSDDFGPSLAQISSSGLRLSRVVRYVVHNSAFKQAEDARSISITRYSGIPEKHRGCSGVDHVILHCGEIYVIPEEALTTSGEIPIKALTRWSWGPAKRVDIKDWRQLLTNSCVKRPTFGY